MQKTTIVCLASDREQSLHSLRKLASVHVVPTAPADSAELTAARSAADELKQLLFFLQALPMPKEKTDGKAQGDTATIDAAEAGACRIDCVKVLAEYKKLTAEVVELDRAIALLEPWGHFDQKILDGLEARGWHTALIVRPRLKKDDETWLSSQEGCPEGAQELVVRATKEKVYSLVLSPAPMDALALPLALFPQGTDLAALQARREELRAKIAEDLASLTDHAAKDMPLLLAEQERLHADAEFLATRDGMGIAGEQLCYLQGFVPDAKLDELRRSAAKNGWALRYESVAADDPQVPTSLVMPKHLGMAKVVLDFIGILPGYNEVDISVAVMVFLALFCGMLVGDAGYGAIACVLTGWGLCKAIRTRNAALRQAMQLLLGMSICTLLWGGLSGNWFGLKWGGLHCLTDSEKGPLNVQLFCFFLAAIHLSLGHIWKMSIVHTWRDRLGNLGWALFLWANFFTVKCLLIDHSFAKFTVPTYMYAVGAVLILLFSVNWKNMGDVIYSPFTFINSIGDILSYIRLYAVGLSSLYIAQAFNDMSAMMWKQNLWLLPVGLLIILAGHLLNIAMALMSVMVHGIRLNTLEFSGHIGVEWGGRPYRPFH